MNFTRRDQPALLQAALAPTGSLEWRPDAVAIGGHAEDGSLAVVAVYQNFCGGEAELHLAVFGRHLLNRTIIGALAMLAFDPRFFNRSKLWCSIADDNPRAQAAALRSGFRFEYRKRGGFMGVEDVIFFSMDRPQPAPPLPGAPDQDNAVSDGQR